MNRDDMRRLAVHAQRRHDPAQQDDTGLRPPRCALCQFVSHPCEAYELATVVLQLLDDDRPDVEGAT